VAPVVTELWGGRGGAPQASPPAAPSMADQRAPAGGALDLFRDPRPSMRGRFDSKT
jgi:hypothetical protein